jgi:hypothetical protein
MRENRFKRAYKPIGVYGNFKKMLTAGEPLPAMFLEDLGGGHAINKKEIY